MNFVQIILKIHNQIVRNVKEVTFQIQIISVKNVKYLIVIFVHLINQINVYFVNQDITWIKIKNVFKVPQIIPIQIKKFKKLKILIY